MRDDCDDSKTPYPGVIADYDVTADGQRFVMFRGASDDDQDRVTLVVNWFEELQRLVPTPPTRSDAVYMQQGRVAVEAAVGALNELVATEVAEFRGLTRAAGIELLPETEPLSGV